MFTRWKHKQKRRPFHYSTLLPKSSTPIRYPQYEPASWQAEAFHASTAHIRCLFGGDRSGKTGTVSYEMVRLIRQFPDRLFWVAGLTEEKLDPIWTWYKTLLAPEEINWKHIHWRVSQIIPKIVPLTSGGRIEFKTMKSGSGAFSAAQVKAIHLDEDGERVTSQMSAIFTDCCSRVLDNDGFVFVAATPVLGKNWMFHRLYRGNMDGREDKQPDPDIQCWTISLLDNQFISDEAKAKQRGRLTQDEIDRRFYGLFTTLSGACFKEYTADIHFLKEEPIISASWRRIRIIDFGYEHDFCCLWMACSDEGVLYVYDEYYQNGTLLEDHAHAIWEKTHQHNEMFQDLLAFRPIETSIADHDKQDRAELENPKLGQKAIYTVPAIKDVDIGIQAVNRYLKVDDNRHAHLYISPRCPKTSSQMEQYHYKPVNVGNEVKEIPHKVDDEGPDCVRYGVMYFDQGRILYDVLT